MKSVVKKWSEYLQPHLSYILIEMPYSVSVLGR